MCRFKPSTQIYGIIVECGLFMGIAAHGDDLDSDGEVLLVAGGVMETEAAGVAQVFHGGGESEEDSSGSLL